MNPKILITGGTGQLGTVLTKELQNRYGKENVVCSDIRPIESFDGIYKVIDATDRRKLEQVIDQYEITQVYHLAAILSANGEKNPVSTWNINLNTQLNVLELAKEKKLDKVFFPSSIAVFGTDADKINTAQNEYLNPTTVYGISKAAGENWCQYYFDRYGVDVRSLRYPGVIGYQSLPGGGTTDYAIDIFYKALAGETFDCFLKDDATLPMIYMEDAIRATIELMEAPKEQIKKRTSYNLAGVSFSPAEIAAEIQKRIPDFKIEYKPDFRQDIAANWPQSIDDSRARNDWGWQHKYDTAGMAEDMLKNIKI